MKDIKTFFIARIIAVLLGMLDAQTLRRLVDRMLDELEDMIAKSETKVDDQIALPLIRVVREAFNVPDEGEFADRPGTAA